MPKVIRTGKRTKSAARTAAKSATKARSKKPRKSAALKKGLGSSGENVGVRTGLKVNVAYSAVFVENEKRTRKWTDQQILQKMQADFPTRRNLAFTTLGGLQAYRSAYNRGKFNGGARPKTQSHPYSGNGTRIEVTRGRKTGVVKTTTAKPKAGKTTKRGSRATAPMRGKAERAFQKEQKASRKRSAAYEKARGKRTPKGKGRSRK